MLLSTTTNYNWVKLDISQLTIVQHFQGSLFLVRQTDDFGDWLLGSRNGTQSLGVRESFYLLNELERHEVEDKGLFLKDDDHHVFPEFDVHDQLVCIEGYLCPVLLLVVVPDDHFVALVCKHQHYHVRFVHHFHNGYFVLKVLHFLLQTLVTSVVLQNFEALGRGNGKVLLGLVGCDQVDVGLDLIRVSQQTTLLFDLLDVLGFVLVDNVLLHHSFFSRHHDAFNLI